MFTVEQRVVECTDTETAAEFSILQRDFSTRKTDLRHYDLAHVSAVNWLTHKSDRALAHLVLELPVLAA